MAFPASMPERTGQTPCPPPVFPANYGGMAFPASMPERIKGLFLGERGLKGEGGNPALNGVASLSLIRKGVFLWNKHNYSPAGKTALC